MATEAKTITLTPFAPGLVRWLRVVYQTDPANAVHIIREGWPRLTMAQAVDVLKGRQELADALAASPAAVPKGWQAIEADDQTH